MKYILQGRIKIKLFSQEVEVQSLMPNVYSMNKCNKKNTAYTFLKFLTYIVLLS